MFNLRERWDNAPPTWRKGFWRIFKALVISLVILALAYWGARRYFDVNFPAITAERVAMFLDAVFAGIVAFALLGAFAFLASIKSPDEDAIDDRISYLYSAKTNQNEAAYRYLKEQVMLLGATVSSASHACVFVEFSADGQYVKSTTSVTMRICNMMKHDTYEQVLPLTIFPEPMPGLTFDPGIVYFVRTTPYEAGVGYGPAVDHLEGPRRLTQASPRYEAELKLTIPPGGELIYEYLFDTWGPLEEVNTCGANRFAESFDVSFRNLTDRMILLSPVTNPKLGRTRTIDAPQNLSPGQELTYPFPNLPPIENIRITSKCDTVAAGNLGE